MALRWDEGTPCGLTCLLCLSPALAGEGLRMARSVHPPRPAGFDIRSFFSVSSGSDRLFACYSVFLRLLGTRFSLDGDLTTYLTWMGQAAHAYSHACMHAYHRSAATKAVHRGFFSSLFSFLPSCQSRAVTQSVGFQRPFSPSVPLHRTATAAYDQTLHHHITSHHSGRFGRRFYSAWFIIIIIGLHGKGRVWGRFMGV